MTVYIGIGIHNDFIQNFYIPPNSGPMADDTALQARMVLLSVFSAVDELYWFKLRIFIILRE